jgi:hypothetical protein
MSGGYVMKKYRVEVWVSQIETWEVLADNEEDARNNYNDGYEKFCTVEENNIENVEEINE